MFIIAVYCPVDHLQAIKQAMFAAGGGQIGNYDSCSFEYRGLGQFRAKAGANPFIGQLGHIEQLAEVKLEMACSPDCISQVITALKSAHPYEEVAFHVIKDESQQFRD